MKNKIIYIISLVIIFCLLLGFGVSAEEIGETTPDNTVTATDTNTGAEDIEKDNSLSLNTASPDNATEDDSEARDHDMGESGMPEVDIGEAILAAIDEHSGEILSLLAFVGSIILALVYKLGLTPLVRGALSSMLNSLGVLKASVEESDSKCTGAVSILEERIASTEEIVKRLDEAIATTTDAIKAEEANSGERADMRLIMQMQINMLYDIFMTSALPQYQKDAVGERISAMNKLLTDRAAREDGTSVLATDIGD